MCVCVESLSNKEIPMKIPLLLLLITTAGLAGRVESTEQPPAKINDVTYIEGKFNVVSTLFVDGKWTQPSVKEKATASKTLNRAFIRLTTPVAFPGATFRFEITLSYDRFNRVYRAVLMDDLNGYLDLYTGDIKDDVLIVKNDGSGTAFPDGSGSYVYGKLEIKKTHNGFEIFALTSSDKLKYEPYMKLTFSK